MSDHIYSTEELSVLLNVGKSTIKRWADEGKLHCFRTPGGHRKFSVADVEQFIRDFNYSIPFQKNGGSGNGRFGFAMPPTIDDIFLENKKRIVDAAVQGDKDAAADAFVGLYGRHISLFSIFDHVLLPVLRQLEEYAAGGRISSVELQISRMTIFSALVRLEDDIKRPSRPMKEVYCITTSDGMNIIELKALELVLESSGIKVFNLGTALSMISAQELIEQCRPDDVFVLASNTPVDDHFREQFVRLRNGVDAYGGIFTTVCFSANDAALAFLMKESRSLEKSFGDIMKHLTSAPSSAAVQPAVSVATK